MTIKVLKSLKYIGFLSTVLFVTISCEKEIENIGVNLIDNNLFSTKDSIFEVIVENVNIDKVPANGISQYLLGVYTDEEFGKLEASIVSQLTLPAIGENYNYGTNAAIDSVLVEIPYQSTKVDNFSDGKPKFTIDSVFGDAEIEFQLNILELKTFLNTLDPDDPTKNAIYYSDKEFLKGDTPLFSGNFKVNPNDTVTVIKRYMPDGITVYDRDTIKQTSVSPTLKITLNESMIQQLFVDNAGGTEFVTNDAFQHYFRGLYIEAKESASANSHIVSLGMTNAKMTIYYSNDEDEGTDTTDAGLDLNGNGIKGEGIVRMKHKYDFSLNSIKSNVLKRDYAVSKQSGNERLYVQGAAGSLVTIELSEIATNLVDLQDNNWLITDANLIFYVDQSALSTIPAPEQLLLYNYDKNLQILDMMTERLSGLGGKLEKDEAGKPYRYVFKITDYISELLKYDDPADPDDHPVNLVKLGLKVYNPTDLPTSFADTKIKEYNWNPKGVVLYGTDISAGDKKIKLEISYTEINN